MGEYIPLLIMGAVIGTFSVIFIAAYAAMKNKKKAIGFDRHMPDSEIVRRLAKYAVPYWKDFLLVLLIMLVSIAYDLLAPLLVGRIERIVSGEFELSELYRLVAVYAGILVISVVCTYFQAIILQVTGQKMLSKIREDVFTHIESLSHAQLHHIPVGKLVTRVTNDTNSISIMFTNIL